MRGPSRPAESGVILLAVLMLVAVLSVISVVVLDDMRFATRRARNGEMNAQARWHTLAAERFARRAVRRLIQADPKRTAVLPAWNGRPLVLPTEAGEIRVTVSDGEACFNLNSVVEGQPGAYAVRPEGVAQLAALAETVGVGQGVGRGLGAALADWMVSGSQGAANQRPGGLLLVDPGEVAAAPGWEPAVRSALAPYLCALPTADLSRLNVNTLESRDAPLLVMLSGERVSLAAAQAALARRPVGGWLDASDFWLGSGLDQAMFPQGAADQIGVATRYFDFAAEATWLDGQAERSGLIEVGRDYRVSTVRSRWSLSGARPPA